jgi:hypothetical protein
MLKLLRWIKNFHQLTWDHEILYADRASECEQILIRPLSRETKNTNIVGGWHLKYEFNFIERTHEMLHLDKRGLVQWKIMDMPTSFIWNIIFCKGAFEYGGGGNFKVLRWMQKLHESTWNYEILHAERPSKDKQLLTGTLLKKIRKWRAAES